MRPIQLIMTAFGPYKQKEVIDFEDLGEHRIFAISGNTGAGKTTILMRFVMCYMVRLVEKNVVIRACFEVNLLMIMFIQVLN